MNNDVFMYTKEIEISCTKITAFVEEQNKAVDEVKGILQEIHNCYETNHNSKFSVSSNQIIQSIRNNYWNNQEFNAVTRNSKDKYEQAYRKNMENISNSEGQLK